MVVKPRRAFSLSIQAFIEEKNTQRDPHFIVRWKDIESVRYREVLSNNHQNFKPLFSSHGGFSHGGLRIQQMLGFAGANHTPRFSKFWSNWEIVTGDKEGLKCQLYCWSRWIGGCGLDPRPKRASFCFSLDLTPNLPPTPSTTPPPPPTHSRAAGDWRLPCVHCLEEAGAARAHGPDQSQRERARRGLGSAYSVPPLAGRTQGGSAKKWTGFSPVLPRGCKFLFHGLTGGGGEDSELHDGLQCAQHLFTESKSLCSSKQLWG